MREHVGVMHQTVSVESVDSLAFHLCITSLTLFGGYLMRIPVVLIEQLFPTGSFWERSNLLSVRDLTSCGHLASAAYEAATTRGTSHALALRHLSGRAP